MKEICRGLIMEGIPGTGKTTLLEKLKEKNIGNILMTPSEFIFSEEITQRVLEKQYNNGLLDKSHNIALLEDIISPLENYQTRLLKRGWSTLRFLYILERFHLTHCTYYPYLSWKDVKDIDDRLKNLGGKLCLLTMDEKIFAERIINRPGELWQNYISRYGKTEAEIIKHYICQQQEFLKMSKKTNLPLLIINTTNINIEEAYNMVKEFLLE
ncbi:MAG TPA: hypothetical protein GXZ78_02685 [Eubacteriaceae bacterium]|jgi:thymidylate kinase|nr:hypothetical protein [Eubacteriaceae bacterium]